jgi:hypothetical protein
VRGFIECGLGSRCSLASFFGLPAGVLSDRD